MTITKVWLRKPDARRKRPQLWYFLEDGSKRYITLDCSLAQAQKEYAKKRDEIAAGKNHAGDHIPGFGRYRETLLEFCERYLIWFHKQTENRHASISPNTFKLRANSLKMFYKIIGDKEVEKIGRQDVETFKSVLSPTHSRNSINTYIRHCSAAWRLLLDAGAVTKNPFSRQQIPGPAGKAAGARFYNEAQQITIHKHLKAAPIAWHYFSFLFSLLTGARIGGVLNANSNNMYQRGDNWLIEIKEKGYKTRDVPIPSALLPHIRNRQAAASRPDLLHSIRCVVTARDYAPYLERAKNGFLVWEVKSEQRGESVSRMFGRHLKALNLPGSFHWLRHTFSMNYLEKGGDIATLSELLGHSDIRTTYKYYAHITTKRKTSGIDDKTFSPED